MMVTMHLPTNTLPIDSFRSLDRPSLHELPNPLRHEEKRHDRVILPGQVELEQQRA